MAEWFGRNARDLPWRRTTDPYAVLVSEIMCQQTQVATVLPYYERWMLQFPDCATLAAATEHEVMSLWQGLGYYSRARNLHRAAKAVVAAGGVFPHAVAEIRALPGVGRYTAGAVAAFAYNQPAALVDANIARLLARVFAVREPIDGAGMARVWDHAEKLQPARNGRAFNAGMMEIGALICTPRAPKCDACPVADFCEAKSLGIAEDLPVKKPRRRTVRLSEPCALITRDGAVLLEKQSGNRWGGLWKLPALERPPETTPELVIEYPFTHHRVTLSVYRGKAPRRLQEGHAWHAVADLADVPLAAAHRRALAKLLAVRP
ncbi:MAG TPA: A/G-specific adenine glycosylase [Chthoniobacteraceae bacterium]|nr:A/G-specific adenine glycosylase [Chthoniobacteraceae bacterium]